MKKQLLYVAMLAFTWSNSPAQNLPTDTARLGDYSYLITGRTHSGCTVQATGFLIRVSAQIYLVTACHVINGWYYESFEKKDSYPDTLFLRVYTRKGHQPVFLPMDIRKLKKQKVGPDSPDVFFYPINLPNGNQANTLEGLIDSDAQGKMPPDEILVYGFCLNEDSDTINIKDLKVSKAYSWLHDKDDYTCDPFVYHLNYAGNDLGPGNSGSPVYFVYKAGPGKVHLQFGGLVFGGAPALHQAVVLRPEIIRNLQRARRNPNALLQ